MITIFQGESYPIVMAITLNGEPLTPEQVKAVEVSVGDFLTLNSTDGQVGFDEESRKWFFLPSQEQTMRLPPGYHRVQGRVKYKNDPAHLHTRVAGMIRVRDGYTKEVL